MTSVPAQRILVVDDEPIVCESVKMMLAFDGHSVETANGGVEALSKYSPEKFDLVITDFCMPGMKGDQLANALKDRCPGSPVLLLTAFPPALKPESIDLVLTKPFYFDTLRQALHQVTSKPLVSSPPISPVAADVSRLRSAATTNNEPQTNSSSSRQSLPISSPHFPTPH